MKISAELTAQLLETIPANLKSQLRRIQETEETIRQARIALAEARRQKLDLETNLKVAINVTVTNSI